MNARLILLALSIQFTLSIAPGFSQTRVVVALPSTGGRRMKFRHAKGIPKVWRGRVSLRSPDLQSLHLKLLMAMTSRSVSEG